MRAVLEGDMRTFFSNARGNIGKLALTAICVGACVWGASRLADVMSDAVRRYVDGDGGPVPDCASRPLHNLYGLVAVERYSQGGYGLITIDKETGRKVRTWVEDATIMEDRATKWPWAAIKNTGAANRGMCVEHAWVRVRSRKDVVDRQ